MAKKKSRRPRQPQQKAPAKPMPQVEKMRPPGGELPAEAKLEDQFAGLQQAVGPNIEKLETVRGHPVLAYYFDERGRLGDEQMLWIYEHLRRIGKQEKLSLWLYSRGGSTVVPVKLVSLLREYAKTLAVLIPYRAHSAASHIAMGADEIVMTEMSELGPVDPSRNHPLLPRVKGPDDREIPFAVSVQDLRHVLSFIEREIGRDEMTPKAAAMIYTALFEKVHPLAIGGLEQSYELAHQVSEAVLATHMDREKNADEIAEISTAMGETYKDHSYPITRREAKQIGLKVVDASNDETRAMWDLFSVYFNMRLDGGGEINGEKAVVARVGHIDSTSGNTLGVQLTSIKNPQLQTTNWQTQWLKDPE